MPQEDVAAPWQKTITRPSAFPATPRRTTFTRPIASWRGSTIPDMNPDDKSATKKFQKIQRAFDVLNNAEKREMYDRYGESFETMGAGAAAGQALGARRPAGRIPRRPGRLHRRRRRFQPVLRRAVRRASPGGLGDLFGQFRRGGARSRRLARRRGADIAHELEIPFNTSIIGGEVQLGVQRPHGQDRDADGEDSRRASTTARRSAFAATARPAAGSGTPGDILITIHVAPHPYFTRQGNHLYVRAAVDVGRGGRRGQDRCAHAHRRGEADDSPRGLQRHEVPHQGARRGRRPAARRATCWPRRKS